VTDLLDNLGLLPLFKLVSGEGSPAAYQESSVTPTNPVELAQTSLDAHKTLMSFNPANVPKFKDVAQFLAEDLAKLERRPAS
jgi:hypothetical protein